MKPFYILGLVFCLISLNAAVPIPAPTDDKKGKGRAPDPPATPPPPSPPPPAGSPPSSSGSTTPPSSDDSNRPLPGRSGTTTGKSGKVTMSYGDDDLQRHMAHLERNQAEFPANRRAMSLSANPDRNRDLALHNVPAAPRDPVTKEPRVRDEKLPAMLHNPRHATSTTVEYLPDKESRKEGGHLSSFKSAIEAQGPKGKGQLRPNPGWLPLDPNQRRGHEAPAKLGGWSQKPQAESSKQPKKPAPPSKAPTEEAKKTGYKPDPVGPSGIQLRQRKAVVPPPERQPKEPKPPKDGPSNLRPGQVLPAGHVWKPSTATNKASHAGAPGPLPGAEQRFPNRPQNKDQHDKAKADAKKPPAPPASGSTKPPSPNLAKFLASAGPSKPAPGKTQEAPARLQTTPRPPSRPPTPARSSTSPPPASPPQSRTPSPPQSRSPSPPQSRSPSPPPPPPPSKPSGSGSKPSGSGSKPAPAPKPPTGKK